MSARPSISRRAVGLLTVVVRIFALPALLWSVLSFAGCTAQIGGACGTNVDCSPLGDRFCDLSSPGGYCTIEGCNDTSCPNNSVCIRFFTLQRGSATCDSTKVPRSDCNGAPDCCTPGTAGCCRLSEQCLCDDAACAQAFCASETSEHRWCMSTCSSNSDCREMYQCYTTGQRGTIAVADRTDQGVVAVPILQFCAPVAGPPTSLTN